MKSSRVQSTSVLALLLGILAMLLGTAAPLARADDKPAQGKTFVIGTDTTYAPFEMQDEASGQMIGIDMDLIRAIAAEQGFTVDIRSLGFDAAVQALSTGQVDAVLAGMTITDKRKETFDFTNPYFQTGLQIAAPQGSTVKSVEDLKGKVLAVKTGTAGATYADSIKAKYGFKTQTYSQTAQMIDAVKADQAQAYIEDSPVVAYAVQQGLAMQLVGDKVPQGYYGMAVRKGTQPELLAAFNAGLTSLWANGGYDDIVSKYLGADAVSTDQPAKGQHFVVGTDTTYAPFEMTDEQTGERIGIDMDLIRAIAAQQGFSVDIKALGFDAAVQALTAKQVDAVIAGMTITDERKKTFDFTDPYYTTGLQIAAPADGDVSKPEDLKGKVLAVKTGTAGATYADSVKDKYGFTTMAYGQTAQMIDAVKAGQAAAYIEDYPVGAYAIKQGLGMELVGGQGPQGDYGMAVNKGANPELVEAFNLGLAKLQASGQYSAIVNSYLSTTASTQRLGFAGLVKQALPALWRGLVWTIAVTALALLIASALGLVFGSFKVGSIAPLRWIADTYVAIFRGTPLLVQIFFVYFTIPQITGLKLSAFAAGVVALSLNAGAYMTEIVRGGIQSVDPGQLEAARSLGLPYLTAMNKVVIPQAIKIATPAFINQFIITLKDTSLVAVIGLAELTFQTQQLIASNYRSELWLVAAALYFIVISLLTLVSNYVDKKVNK